MSNFCTGTPATNSNAVPPAGTLAPAWIPCLAQLTSFTPNSPTGQDGAYPCTGGPGLNSTQNLFLLQVPPHFFVPTTHPCNPPPPPDLRHFCVPETPSSR